MMQSDMWVDNEAHQLHLDGHVFPCDRDIEAAMRWHEYALLLSSDTDCLSLWDSDGLVRLAKVGVYPQDMAVQGEFAYVCGGADGKLHLLRLPDLHEAAEYMLPGMPERVCLARDAAYVLTLLPEPEVHTALLSVDLATGKWSETAAFGGIPEAITADKSGLWIAVSEGVVRMRWAEIHA